ncbi:hypothetical protein WR25_11495 [Diploscapter pachys]|uniref:Uncharacterized protein n=1 Tax=Diploscapter pachys TaxID=2018661 RepID=A0A2A2L6Y1_9BILA|nr:hypothetical protein WR25_11495 [Diploscapter pachys]
MKFLDWTKIFYALSILAAVEGCARTAPGEGELTTLGPDDTTPLPSGATTMPGSDSTTTPDGDVTSGSTAAPTTESTTAMTSTSNDVKHNNNAWFEFNLKEFINRFQIALLLGHSGLIGQRIRCVMGQTIGSGSNYYTMDQYKNGACNTFHTGAEPASFTSQEQWDYLVGADGMKLPK